MSIVVYILLIVTTNFSDISENLCAPTFVLRMRVHTTETKPCKALWFYFRSAGAQEKKDDDIKE